MLQKYMLSLFVLVVAYSSGSIVLWLTHLPNL